MSCFIVGDAPKLLEGLEDLTVIAPELAEFFCDVQLGTPKSEIHWFKNDKPIQGSKYETTYIAKDESACLTINKTDLADAGEYKIVIKNELGEVSSTGKLIIHTKPTVTLVNTKSESTQKAGSTHSLSVDVTGHPQPTVSWQLNDMPIESKNGRLDTSDTHSKLTLKPVSATAAGTYTVTATNQAGSDTALTTVTVIDKPTSPLNLQVSDVTSDSFVVSWKVPESNGGSEITSYVVERQDVKRGTWMSAGTTKPNTRELAITKLVEGNEYLVRVFAENDVGASEPAALDQPVTAKNPFCEPGPPQNLSCEDVTSTSCRLLWNPPKDDGGAPVTAYVVEKKSQFNARWTKVTKASVRDTELELSDLVDGTDYEFRVSAENKAGIGKPCQPIGPVTAQAPKVPVQFVSEIADQTVEDEQTAVFECEVNKPNMAAHWKRNGVMIQPSEKYVMTVDGSKHRLEIHNCQPLDKCRIEVAIEDANSGADLEVNKIDVELVKPLEDITSDESPKTVTFVCEMSKPDLPAKWIRNGKPLELTSRFRPNVEGCEYSLRIKDATPEDQAQYTCLVKGVTTSAELKFLMRPTLKLNKKYEDVIVIKTGQSTVFEVPFHGYPKPEVKWMHNDEELVSTKRVEIETISGLTCVRLKNAERSDMGKYTVSVTNPVCDVSADITLEVIGKPSAPLNFQVKETAEETVTLTWDAPADNGGREVTHYVLDKKDVGKRSYAPVSKPTELTATVASLREGHSYLFQVCAVNSVGQGEPVELEKPVVPTSKHSKSHFNLYLH